MIFDRLFKKKDTANSLNSNASAVIPQTPAIEYVHTSQNREMVKNSDNDILVLWWIAGKKKGYEIASNKFPKWFMTQYGIDFNKLMNSFISRNHLQSEKGIVSITQIGKEELKKFDYVVYVHEHPKYCLNLNEFKNSPNLHKVQNSDIAWSVFNSRIIEYMRRGMWSSLSANYGNMADLLIDEGRYDQALDFVFASAYAETSGMRDNNELTAIMAEPTKNGWKNKSLPNGMPDIFMMEINNYYVTDPFLKIQEKLKLEWSDIKNRFINSRLIANLEENLPFRYFEKEQSFEFMKQAVEAGSRKGIFTLSDCNAKMKWNKPDENSSLYFYSSIENKMKKKGY